MNLLLHLFMLIIFYYQSTCFRVSGAIECNNGSQKSSKIAYTLIVSQAGDANFTSVKDAIDFIPSGNNQWIKILLKPGIYKERLKIEEDKGCIVLEGSDSKTTIITSDAPFKTHDSVTFSVFSDNFIAKGVTFENSLNKALKGTNQKPIEPDVAFGSFGDKHSFYSCGFIGYQDTLWDDNNGRHYFNSCYIEGAADFIWGNGQSVYEQCDINVTGDGFITAQGRTLANETSGYVFRRCNVSGTGHVDLGRAYRAFSRVIFIDSSFSNVVNPEGWFIWNQIGHENDVTYAEVDCTGPGADTSKRVPWVKKLNSLEVEQYTTKAFIDQDEWIAKQPL